MRQTPQPRDDRRVTDESARLPAAPTSTAQLTPSAEPSSATAPRRRGRLRWRLAVVAATLLIPTLVLPRGGVGAAALNIGSTQVIASLPTSGSAYDAVVSAANDGSRPNLADQASNGNVGSLARAFLGRKSEVIADLRAARSSLGSVERTLSLARELQPLPLAARVAGVTNADVGFDLRAFFLDAINHGPIEGRDASTVRESARIDPTNWGSHARATVMWVAWYTGDAGLIAEAYDNVARYLRGGSSGFVYHDDQVSWGRWTIAPAGTSKSGFDLDGAIHDIYRGGTFPTVGADGQNYVWEASQGNVSAAIAADLAGHAEVWNEGNRALLRSMAWMYRTSGVGGATGDDRWQPWVLRQAYGSAVSWSLASPTSPGKGFGFADWLYPALPTYAPSEPSSTETTAGDGAADPAASDSDTSTTDPAPTLSAYPPNRTLSYVATPSLARPGYLSRVTDPTWGTQVVRVSDHGAMNTSQPHLRHAYARTQPWNSDQSLLLLSYTYPSALLDGTTYAFKRWLNNPAYATWANTNPRYLYGTWGGTNQFVRMDATTGSAVTLRTFSGYDTISLGDGEGYLSDDDRYVALMARAGSKTALIVYDISANQIVAERDLGGLWPNNATISPSGRYVFVNWAGGAGPGGSSAAEIWGRDLVYQRTLSSWGQHGDLGWDAAGNEVYVQAGADLPMWRLDTGSLTRLLPAGNSAYGESHVSLRGRKGWVTVSHYAPPNTKPGSDQVVMVRADGSGTVQVYAHAHHKSSVSAYAHQPHAVASRDGRRVLFASEWGGSNAYAYVAGMNP